MPLHAINKQVFEVNCNDEVVAKAIQKDIENYTAFQINRIIESVLDKLVETDVTLKIDKIEIDLGDVEATEFGADEMLQKFREILTETISDLKNSAETTTNNHPVHQVKKRVDGDWNLVTSFLRSGDVPWWLNKNDSVDMDAIFQKEISLRPAAVASFIKSHEAEPEVLKRLTDLMKPATKRMLSLLLPTSIVSSTRRSLFQFEDSQAEEQLSFSKNLLEIFSRVLQTAKHDSSAEQSAKLLSALCKIVGLLQHDYSLPVNKTLGFVFSKQEVIKQERGRLGKDVKEQLKRFIKTLSVYQVEVLLFQSSLIAEWHAGKKSSPIDTLHIKNDQLSQSTARQDLPVDNKMTSISHATGLVDAAKNYHRNAGLKAAADRIQSMGDLHSTPARDETRTRMFKDQENEWNPIAVGHEQVSIAGNEPGKIYLSPEIIAAADYPTQHLAITEQHLNRAISGEDIVPAAPLLHQKKKHDPVLLLLRTLAYIRQRQSAPGGSPGEADFDTEISRVLFKNLEMVAPPSDLETSQQKPWPVLHPVKDSGVESSIEKLPSLKLKPGEEESLTDINSPDRNLFKAGERKAVPQTVMASRTRQVAYIMKKLLTADPILRRYLEHSDELELQRLVKMLKQQERNQTKRRGVIKALTTQPGFFEYEVLKIFAAIYFPDTQQLQSADGNAHERRQKKKDRILAGLAKTIEISREGLFYLIDRLPLKEIIILGDIFRKRKCETDDERRILRKILNGLSDEAVLLMKFITELPEKELAGLRSAGNKSAVTGSEPNPFARQGGIDVVPNVVGAKKPANDLTQLTTDGYRHTEEKTFYKPERDGKIYIENAGLCLIALYLRGLFNNLGYLEKGLCKSMAFVVRAVYLTQYIATGKNKYPEYQLQFNKILCGFNVDNYVNSGIRLTKKEKSEADALLQSVIENWKALKNTSIDGFRESFIERKGILTETDLYWTLQIERKGFDMLLNTIPWGFSIIKLPWMKKHVRVEW